MSFVDGGVYLSLGIFLRAGLCVPTELSTFSFSRWCWIQMYPLTSKADFFLSSHFPSSSLPCTYWFNSQLTKQSQEGAQVANDEKKSSYVALLSPSQFCWQMDGSPSTIWVLKRSEVGSGEGRGHPRPPSWKATGQGFVGASTPSHLHPRQLEKGPRPPSETGPNCCQTSERSAWTHTRCWRLLRATAYLHPPVLLGVAVSLPR